MDNKRNKLRSFMKQMQNSTEEMLARRPSVVTSPTSPSSSASTSSVIPSPNPTAQQLDLSSAIEYNHYLTSSYLEERNARELPLYGQILQEPAFKDQTPAETEQMIIKEIRAEFFIEVNQEEELEDDEDSDSELETGSNQKTPEKDAPDASSITLSPNLKANFCDPSSSTQPPPQPQFDSPSIIFPDSADLPRSDIQHNQETTTNSEPELFTQSKVLELCILSKLPDFDDTESALSWINEEKKRLTRQVTIVSKSLTDLITENDENLKQELKRVSQIDGSLLNAIEICGNGRKSLSLSRRDFTSSALSIIDNYHRRQSIIAIISSLQQTKTIRSTIEHIKSLLELEKNFPSAIRLYHETAESLEMMAADYACVGEMKTKLVEMLLLAEEQMDQVLSRMPVSFCPKTYQQLSSAYKQIGKTEGAIHQLLMHFTNLIHDKAFSIVLGYVELFSADLLSGSGSGSGGMATSTPVKSRKAPGSQQLLPAANASSTSFDLKRKPFSELCLLLNPDSFLACLTDLCRAMWDTMQNYYRVLCFYRSQERLKSSGLAEEEVDFAVSKLEHGVLRVWSDIQHKIRTLVASVKFVEVATEGANGVPSAMDLQEDAQEQQQHHQDQLYFTFDEFIKILTVCEKMIDIGEEFCLLYRARAGQPVQQSVTHDLQTMLHQQTRNYFTSYHQVSMAELRIFLENETWTRIPVETADEFTLIASLQEFAFIKRKLLKMRGGGGNGSKPSESNGGNSSARSSKSLTSPKSSTSTSSFLFSPNGGTLKAKHKFFASYFTTDEDFEEIEIPDVAAGSSPFDDILSLATTLNHTVYTSDGEVEEEEDDDDVLGSPGEFINATEIATTNTALNVVRLTGRYMHIMYLLRSISHNITKALMELFDYYFFTVYRFFAVDALNTGWLSTCISSVASATSNLSQTMDFPAVAQQQHSSSSTATANPTSAKFSQISSELRSFVRRINDTLIINEQSSSSQNNQNSSIVHSASASSIRSGDLEGAKESANTNNTNTASQSATPNASPKRIIKYPSPSLPEYVSINDPSSLYALPERIMAIGSLIFIARQFYNLCPFLLDILRNDEQIEETEVEANSELVTSVAATGTKMKQTEDGFKLLQFYHDEMCLSVESLIYQCLFAVSTKLLPYESIIAAMGSTKWDLKEIPSIHSRYVDTFIAEICAFNEQYITLLQTYDLGFMLPGSVAASNISAHASTLQRNGSLDPDDVLLSSSPLEKLEATSQRINHLLWECLTRVSNRCFVEGFASAKKCTNEGRALMQLDYQQFLSHMEKIISEYFVVGGGVHASSTQNNNSTSTSSALRAAKALLTAEKEFVEEYVKAYYLTEAIFLHWVGERSEYTSRQIVSLVNCIAGDNRRLKTSLLSAIDSASNAVSNATTANNANGSFDLNTTSTSLS